MHTQAVAMTRPITAPMTRAILQHLQKVGDITQVEAQAIYKCRSLSRRITDLREAGFLIDSRLKRDMTGQRYVRYHYLGRAL